MAHHACPRRPSSASKLNLTRRSGPSRLLPIPTKAVATASFTTGLRHRAGLAAATATALLRLPPRFIGGRRSRRLAFRAVRGSSPNRFPAHPSTSAPVRPVPATRSRAATAGNRRPRGSIVLQRSGTRFTHSGSRRGCRTPDLLDRQREAAWDRDTLRLFAQHARAVAFDRSDRGRHALGRRACRAVLCEPSHTTHRHEQECRC